MTQRHHRPLLIHVDRYPQGVAQLLAWDCVAADASETSTLLLRAPNAHYLLHEHVSSTGSDRIEQLDISTARAIYERLPVQVGPFEQVSAGGDVGAPNGQIDG